MLLTYHSDGRKGVTSRVLRQRVLAVHDLVGRQAYSRSRIVNRHVLRGPRCVSVLRRGDLEHVSFVHLGVDWHYFFSKYVSLQVPVQVRLVLRILLYNLLDLASHLNVSGKRSCRA